jgi:hypothetical protein
MVAATSVEGTANTCLRDCVLPSCYLPGRRQASSLRGGDRPFHLARHVREFNVSVVVVSMSRCRGGGADVERSQWQVIDSLEWRTESISSVSLSEDRKRVSGVAVPCVCCDERRRRCRGGVEAATEGRSLEPPLLKGREESQSSKEWLTMLCDRARVRGTSCPPARALTVSARRLLSLRQSRQQNTRRSDLRISQPYQTY